VRTLSVIPAGLIYRPDVSAKGRNRSKYFTESELAVHSIRYLSFDELCGDRNRDMERAAGICHENRKVGEVFRY